MASARGIVPKLVVFDLDMCLWSPEMFELDAPPSRLDGSTNTVICGRDRVKLFPGAVVALKELHEEEVFSETIVAVASSTSQGSYANKCLSLIEVSTGVVMRDVISHFEIYNSNKTKHFRKLHDDTGIASADMLFFDDCNWGDNCRDVSRGFPGVVTVKTPEGLTIAKWREGLEKFSRRAQARTATK